MLLLKILAALLCSQFTVEVIPTFTVSVEPRPEEVQASVEPVKPERRYLAMFTAKWCGPCQICKRTTIPQIEAAGYHVQMIEMTDPANWKYSQQIFRYPTFVVCDWYTGEWLSDPIIGGIDLAAIEKKLGRPVQTPETRLIQQTIQPQNQSGRYTTYGGRTYDWENETYGKCSLLNCPMCNHLYNACWTYRRSRGLSQADDPQGPTPDDVIEEGIDLLNLKPKAVLAELGCGDGRVIVRAIQRCIKEHGSPCRAIGVEIDPVKVAAARRMIADHGLSDWVTILEGDVREFSPERHSVPDVPPVTHIYAFLYPDLLLEIADTLTSVDVSVCPGHECPGIGQRLFGQCWVYRKA